MVTACSGPFSFEEQEKIYKWQEERPFSGL